ncbi:MAG: hypothetical protein F4241_04455 [Rhodothermaceae bacterium]|nr:hypothetical protein [Rhodothermaceae bacterium]
MIRLYPRNPAKITRLRLNSNHIRQNSPIWVAGQSRQKQPQHPHYPCSDTRNRPKWPPQTLHDTTYPAINYFSGKHYVLACRTMPGDSRTSCSASLLWCERTYVADHAIFRLDAGFNGEQTYLPPEAEEERAIACDSLVTMIQVNGTILIRRDKEEHRPIARRNHG